MARSHPDRGSGVTLRAILTALGLLVAVVAFHVVLVHFTSNDFGTGVPACAPFAVLFLLTAVMMIPAARRRVGFRRREIPAIYAVVLIGAPLVSQSVLGWMLPHSVIQQYIARAIPDWETGFLHLVPTWFTPTDPVAVEGFFIGQSAVPWSLWWTPLAAWCSFLLALIVASVCLTVLVGRQWVVNERLSFPLAQIPLETVAAPDFRERPGAAAGRPDFLEWSPGLFLHRVLQQPRRVDVRSPVHPGEPDHRHSLAESGPAGWTG